MAWNRSQRMPRTCTASNICDGADCPAYDLPADNTPARWLKDGRLEQGRFIIDGHRVGLAGPDGELLKEAER